jgi:hypothetical protein
VREGYNLKPLAVYKPKLPKVTRFVHADNLVKFSNDSLIDFNKELNFSFMHAIFAVLLEVKDFKQKFMRIPPFQLRLQFNQRSDGTS